MSDKEKWMVKSVAAWMSNNIDIDEGMPLVFEPDSLEQDYLEELLNGD